jgi:ATP-dependent helicase YprA (DUF1998 family)
VKIKDTLGGKPRLEERRISVLQISEMYIDGGTSPERIADELEIGLDEVHEALAYYYKHPDKMDEIRERQRELHAVEHAMVNMTPLELMVDSKDIGGLSTRFHSQTEGPTMFIYDGVDGGIGFSRAIYDKYLGLAERSEELIAGCDCEGTSGCPSCVMDYMCGDNNEPMHTDAAVEILEDIIDA